MKTNRMLTVKIVAAVIALGLVFAAFGYIRSLTRYIADGFTGEQMIVVYYGVMAALHLVGAILVEVTALLIIAHPFADELAARAAQPPSRSTHPGGQA